MHRFFIESDFVPGQLASLGESDSHHASRVLRLGVGDRVVLLNGRGSVGDATLVSATRNLVSARIETVRQEIRDASEIVIIFALAKPKAMEFVIQKCTELGVAELVVVPCARSVSRVEVDEVGGKLLKWKATALEALKQSGGRWLPRIEWLAALGDLTLRPEVGTLRMVASLGAGALHPRRVFDRVERSEPGFPRRVEVYVGPEGDFTEEELNLLHDRGACGITFGENVLRCETAAVYGAMVCQYEVGYRALMRGGR